LMDGLLMDGVLDDNNLPRAETLAGDELQPGSRTMAGRWPAPGFIGVVPEEILCRMDRDAFLDLTEEHGFRITDIIELGMEMDLFWKKMEPAMENHLLANGKVPGTLGIVFFQEAWMPPINETLELIGTLRKLAGRDAPFVVMLTGKPEPGNLFTKVSGQDYAVWKKKLSVLGDAWLSIETMIID
ncbi:MAG: DUF2868 domain-containing protein, partial [Desulfamplus sp.]|nr:DUF2868 domain-containing protein [Desulfamplus sp.]